ncbi:FAD:protein FMN transferase [Arthrobacter sp. UYEF20]|uniref:FAD:protein FMN transferase n=1 Tax=Arthrobacter sp. UYEF20 TaxID=1756363 RepID=UPI003396A7AE
MQRTSEFENPGVAPPALKTRTFGCMGTVISLTMPFSAAHAGTLPRTNGTEHPIDAATAAVERLFGGLDETFSLYRPESEASSLARGEITLREASQQVRDRYAEAAGWRLLTLAAFTPERPDGVLDLSGIVKGYAIQQAGATLRSLKLEDWCLNAGGDVLVGGAPVPGSRVPWQSGIVDPQDRAALLSAFPLGGCSRFSALATSGSAERGDHIWSAGARRSEFRRSEFLQVSVAAADIVTADVLATAIVAGGRPMLDRATGTWDVEVLAVRCDGGLLATPGFRAQVPAGPAARGSTASATAPKGA